MPTLVVQNLDAAGSGALFTAAVPDPQGMLLQIARDDCELLYRTPAEVPAIAGITLVVENIDGVAYTTAINGSEVHLSSKYLQSYQNGGGNLANEINGVIHHEFVHVYQFDNDNYGGITWLIEGIADFVRYRAGFVPLANRRHGGAYTDSYQVTAFFLDYLDRTYPNFVYNLNHVLAPKDKSWTVAYFATVTGKEVDTLWGEYQSSF
jgi:hypothetical protein